MAQQGFVEGQAREAKGGEGQGRVHDPSARRQAHAIDGDAAERREIQTQSGKVGLGLAGQEFAADLVARSALALQQQRPAPLGRQERGRRPAGQTAADDDNIAHRSGLLAWCLM